MRDYAFLGKPPWDRFDVQLLVRERHPDAPAIGTEPAIGFLSGEIVHFDRHSSCLRILIQRGLPRSVFLGRRGAPPLRVRRLLTRQRECRSSRFLGGGDSTSRKIALTVQPVQ